jgi:TnpA family transposase
MIFDFSSIKISIIGDILRRNMKSKTSKLIIENVKIDKTMFMEIYTHEEWL